MAAITIVRVNNISGTSFVLDVQSLSLDANLSILDFRVTHNGLDRTSSYTKTSQTQLTYAGANVVLGTVIQVTRVTQLSDSEVTFISTTTALKLTNSLTKLKKRIDELESFIDYQSALITSGGVSPGVIPVIDANYSSAWDNDVNNAPSRNSVYDVINRIDSGSNTWNGSYNAGAASLFQVPTPSTGDSTSKAASTQFTRNALDDRLRLFVNRTSSISVPTGSNQDLQLNNVIVNRDGYNTGTFTWTAPAAGNYLVHLFALPIATGGTLPTNTIVTAIARVNSSDNIIGASQLNKEFAYAQATYVFSLSAGDTVRPRVLIEPTGGSGFTYTVGANALYRPEMTIIRLT